MVQKNVVSISKNFFYSILICPLIQLQDPSFIQDWLCTKGRADYTFLTVEKWNGKYIIKYADWFRGKDDEFVKEVVRELYQKFENGNGTFVIADSSNAGNLFIKKITSIGIPVVEQKFAQVHRNNLFHTSNRT